MEESPPEGPPLTPTTSSNATPRPPRSQGDGLSDAVTPTAAPRPVSEGLVGDRGREEGDATLEMDLRHEMQLEKQMYPGAPSWAPDEERLFEILFLRQDMPLLPPHWELDFQGVPFSENVFNTSSESPAIVYEHSEKQFQATTALMRLIDLTSRVRTSIQSGLRNKVAEVLKKGLDRFLSWAAEDGGYGHLETVPNIVAEIVDTAMSQGDIERFMMWRMRRLGRLQREFFRVDRHPQFWATIMPDIMNAEFSMDGAAVLGSTPSRKPGSGAQRKRASNSPKAGAAELTARHAARKDSTASEDEKRRLKLLDEVDLVKWYEQTESPQRPASQATYRRPPPVIYGLFILSTSVFVLTLDSSKGDGGYVSFHVDVDFFDSHQSVWNALTVAVVACLARDGMRGRLGEFESLPTEAESDPDA